MKKKWIIQALLLVFICITWTTTAMCQDVDAVGDEYSLYSIQELIEALEANDQAMMEELVRQTGAHLIYALIMYFAGDGIARIAEGEDASLYFNAAEATAATYAKEFNKEGTVELVRSYRLYTREMCKEILKAEELGNEGNSYYEQGQGEEALEKWDEAVEIFNKLGYAAPEAAFLSKMGTAYDKLGHYTEALNHCQLALEISRKIGDMAAEVNALHSIGVINDHLGQYTEALNYSHNALEIARSIGYAGGEAKNLFSIARVYYTLGQYPEASDYKEKAIDVFKKTSDIASVYQSRGQLIKALAYYYQILDISQVWGRADYEVDALKCLGALYGLLEQYDEALDYALQALELSQSIADTVREAAVLSNVAITYDNLKQYDKALDYYNKALQIRQSTGDMASQAKILFSIERVYDILGQDTEASDYKEKAIEVFQEILDTGFVYQGRGQYNQALEYFEKFLEISRMIGYEVDEAAALLNIGGIYGILGQHTEALDYYQQALEVSQRIGFEPGKANALGNIGIEHVNLGRYTEALNYHLMALEIHRSIANRAGEAVDLFNIGVVYDKLGQFDKASDYKQQALQLTKQYVNQDYGFQLQVPAACLQTDKRAYQRWLPGAIEFLSGENMQLMIVKRGSTTIDSACVDSILQASRDVEKITRGIAKIEKGPELIKIGEIPAIVWQQGYPPGLGLRFDFSLVVVVSDESKSIVLNYYFARSDKEKLLSVAEKSYQTFEFIPVEPSEVSEMPAFDIWKSIWATELNDVLRIVFRQYSWDHSSLKKAMQEINELKKPAGLPLNFLDPDENIAPLAQEDSSEIWKLYLNIFHMRNFLQWYPTIGKKVLRPNVYAQVLEKCEKILDIKVTQDQWRKVSYSIGKRAIVTVHSNLGSGLKIADIAAVIDELYKRKLFDPGAEVYIDNREFLQAKERMYRWLVDENLSFNIPNNPIFEDVVFVTVAGLGIYDVRNRLKLSDEVLKVSTEDLKIDVYIYKDKTSFAKAGGLPDRRAFTTSPEDGVCLVHVKVPERILGFEYSALFRLIIHGEDEYHYDKYTEKYEELLKRLLCLKSDLSAVISHELDHALFVPGEGKPKWLAEGQATYFGEMMNEWNRSGIEVAWNWDSLAVACEGFSNSEAWMSVLQAFKENLYSTDREVDYAGLLKARKSRLIRDFRDLVLAPDDTLRGCFHDPQRETLNYALSWGLFKTVKYAASQKPEDWARFKPDWDRLTSTRLSDLRDAVFKGKYDSFFEWIASLIEVSLKTRRSEDE